MKQLSSLLFLVVLASPLGAEEYVLTAGKWGRKQTDAVLRAGGTVTWSHGPAGVGTAISDNPDFLQAVLDSGAVASAARDQIVEWAPVLAAPSGLAAPTTAPAGEDDPLFALQWGPQAVGAPAAWARGCTGAGVRVAIVDGGLYDRHEDLVANVDVARSISFVPHYPFNADTTIFWHGTLVAGVVAAADNGVGGIGIAPEATLIGVKVAHANHAAFAWILRGILYAATPLDEGGGGADIINLSLGATLRRNAPGVAALSAALNRAMAHAARNGVLVISAAGNSALDMDHDQNLVSLPAQSGSGIAVSATAPVGFAAGATDFDRLTSYSNYGSSAIWVAAPGGGYGYYPNDLWWNDMIWSTTRGDVGGGYPPGGGYLPTAGTSFAAPAAAAVAALILQQNPGMSLGALKTALKRATTDAGKPGHDPFYGAGFVNADLACTP